jgi:hypothetical protein
MHSQADKSNNPDVQRQCLEEPQDDLDKVFATPQVDFEIKAVPALKKRRDSHLSSLP